MSKPKLSLVDELTRAMVVMQTTLERGEKPSWAEMRQIGIVYRQAERQLKDANRYRPVLRAKVMEFRHFVGSNPRAWALWHKVLEINAERHKPS
jgi:hypothetical protein